MDNMNPQTMVDFDLVRDWDGATISVTIYNGDYDLLTNLHYEGFHVIKAERII